MSNRNDFAALADRLERAATSLERRALARSTRGTLQRAARAVARAVATDLGAWTPPRRGKTLRAATSPLGRARVEGAVRVQVLKGLRGGRIYVSNRGDRAMQSTFRPGQPRLPLAFWFEGGYKERRGRGPQGGMPGADALGRHQGDIMRYENELVAAVERYGAGVLNKLTQI